MTDDQAKTDDIESRGAKQGGTGSSYPVSRRHFVKTVSGGIVLGGVGLVSAKGRDDTIEIPVTLNHEGVARTKVIPLDAYKYDEHVKKLAKKFSRQKNYDRNIASVMVTSSKKKIKGHPVTKLKVGVPPEGNESKVPDSLEGVPVEKIPAGRFHPGGHGGCHNDSTYDPVPGGVKITAEDTVASGFGKVMDMSNGEPRYMTCAHVAEDRDDVSCGTGEGLSLWQGPNYMGDIVKASKDGDWAIAKETSGDEIQGYDRDILWKGYGRRDFEEFYTESGLREVMKNGTATYKMGLTSGSTSGVIDSMYADEEYWCTRTVDSAGNPYGVILTVDGGGGDSGSPVFTKYPSNPSEKLSAAGHWVAYDDKSDSYDTGCDPSIFVWGSLKAFERTLMIPSYYIDNEYSIQPWLI